MSPILPPNIDRVLFTFFVLMRYCVLINFVVKFNTLILNH